jgi:hypothetical protein
MPPRYNGGPTQRNHGGSVPSKQKLADNDDISLDKNADRDYIIAIVRTTDDGYEGMDQKMTPKQTQTMKKINELLAAINPLYTATFTPGDLMVDAEITVNMANLASCWAIQAGELFTVQEYEFKDGKLDSVINRGTFRTLGDSVKRLCSILHRQN